MPTSLAELYGRLARDEWRTTQKNQFSEDIALAQAVLHDPFAREPERREALECWLQGTHQPCLFGRLAAKRAGLHYCFLSVEDLVNSDDAVREKIAASKRLWKQRAYRGIPKHGFMLSVCDAKVASAAPDEALRQFALHLQTLAGWTGRSHTRNNEIVDEWLYLRHPKSTEIVKFTFSVDFFASAGDKRWWHDHRVPGGMAFTANSLGHMVRWQEWYENRTDRTEWALRTAMLTIDAADKNAPHAPATYLLDETPGRPLRPYSWTVATKPSDKEKLRGKDCGSYGGYLHTDHAVRAEFFQPQEAPLHKDQPYPMDFTYIFDAASADHAPFLAGHPANIAEVEAELHLPGELHAIATTPSGAPKEERSAGASFSLEAALVKCRAWKLSDADEATLC